MSSNRVCEGVIESAMPKALYRVRLDEGRTVTASTTREVRQITIKFLPGDRVSVELSPYDPSRGRIVARLG